MILLRKDRAPAVTRGRAEWSHVSSVAVGESCDGFSHSDRSPRPGGTTKTAVSCYPMGSLCCYNGVSLMQGPGYKLPTMRMCKGL